MAKRSSQMVRFHRWEPETAWIDEQLRAAGCVALVDVENENLFIFPGERLPKALAVQLVGLNNKALGRQYCVDLMNEAGYTRKRNS